MASDKRITRPVEPIPSWANDDLLSDPGETWDGESTKIQPGAGKRDDGWLPEESPPAQHQNQLMHELGQWAQFLSDVQVMNWEDVGEPKEVSTQSAFCVTWDEGLISWVVGGRADIVTFSPDGENWTDISPGLAKTWTWTTSKRPGDAPTHTIAATLLGHSATDATPTVAERKVGAWNSQVLPKAGATAGSTTGVWDVGNQLWLVGGEDNSLPSFWYDNTPITGFTQVVPGAVNSAKVIQIATNRAGDSVAIGDATPFDVWTSSSGIGWNRATPTGITGGETAASIAWDPDSELWVLLTNSACYTSATGTAWTKVSPSYTAQFQIRSLAIAGSHWVSVASSFPVIHFSSDGGRIWRYLRVSVGVTTGNPLTDIAYSRGRGRFMTVWEEITGGRAVRSLAVPTTVQGVDAIVIPAAT